MSDSPDKEEVPSVDKPKEEKKKRHVVVKDATREGASEKAQELRTQTHKWIEYEQDDGTVLKGSFTIQRPTVMDLAKIGVRRAQLAMGMNDVSLDQMTSNILEWAATCDVCVVGERPPWFDFNKLYDMGVFEVVYSEVRKFMQTFPRRSVGE